jgi:hypothetical protein
MRTLLVFGVVVGSVLWGAAAEKPRVYVTDSKSWQLSGGNGGSAAGFGGAASGGDRPQTAEIIKTFGERCPGVIINNKQDKADYVVLLDHEGGKSPISRDNKVVVFNKDGDSIMSHSTRSLGNAVKDVCDAVAQDWPKQVIRAANTRSKSEGSGSNAASKRP